tara:strand:- start:66370 stop:69537 length:3168 start_codon:yes stop_codon:yes gene_type:complete
MKHKQRPNLRKETKKQGLMKKLIKASTIHVTCWSLLYVPSAYAVDADGVLDGIGQGIQMAGQIVQGLQQQRQQQMQQAQLQAQMQSLTVQPVPSKYFPNCPVLPGVTNYPENACTMPAPGDTAGVSRIQQFKALAIENESTFEDMMSIGQNSRTPKGIQCLEDSLKNTESTLQDMLNNLESKITQVKVANQQFKQNITKIKEEMESTRAELYGNPSNETDKNKNLISEFSPQCQQFYGAKGKLQTVQQGFTGIRNESEENNQSAGKFLNNKNSYVSEVKSQIDAIKNEISKNGLAIAGSQESLTSAINSALLESGSSTQFGSISNILSAKVSNFNREFKLIQDDLKDVNFNLQLDDFDGNFQDKYSNFSKGAYEYFKKEAITACVNGSSNTIGLGLSTDQILNGLRSKAEGGSSTTLANYRQALKNILDSDAFIEDKMDAIAQLDSRFGVGNIYIKMQNADAQGVTMTPYGLYQSQIDACEARINQDDTFSTDSSKRATDNSTYADRIAKAEKAIKKALNLESKFQNELATSLYNRVVNCEGIQPKTDRCQFGSEAGTVDLEPSSPNFCVSNATTCANQINSCYKEAETIIAKKEVEMKAHAANYNSLVSGVIAQQQQLLNQIKAQVIADAEYIKQYIPGAAYEFPADLFVEMPEEMMVASLGVALRGGEELASLDDLEKKLASMKDMLAKQGDKVASEIGDYIADQSSNMQSEYSKWTSLKEECSAAEQAYNQAATEANNQMAETYNDALNFCQKYTAMATNPAAGCGDADGLYEDAMNVSSQFLANSGAIKAQAIQYKNFCNSANNEGQNSSDTSSSDDNDAPTSEEIMFDDLGLACDEFKTEEDNKDFIQSLGDQVFASLPGNISNDDQKELERFFEDPSERPSFSREFRRSTYYRNTLSQVISGISNMSEGYSKPEDVDVEKLSDSTKADYEKWDELSFCNRYLVESEINVATKCADLTPGSEDHDDCKERNSSQPFRSSNETAKTVARAIASINDSVTTSDSGRIGEQMNGVPCMAQQGNNGAMGGNIFSGLSNAAQAILGIGGGSTFGQ